MFLYVCDKYVVTVTVPLAKVVSHCWKMCRSPLTKFIAAIVTIPSINEINACFRSSFVIMLVLFCKGLPYPTSLKLRPKPGQNKFVLM